MPTRMTHYEGDLRPPTARFAIIA
ncbi:6,7-dimethyl-8-ribityllumazine synthase, partial [Xanthomonas oryzae pv. oryzae]